MNIRGKARIFDCATDNAGFRDASELPEQTTYDEFEAFIIFDAETELIDKRQRVIDRIVENAKERHALQQKNSGHNNSDGESVWSGSTHDDEQKQIS
tara:strand:+ start:1675 stop:1965 length:291 start_codon:yes stop_codon:yes gene_type:complete